MTDSISASLFSRFNDLVASRMGLHFPPERRHDLEHRLGSAAREFGFSGVDACLHWLLSSSLTKEQLEVLASHLTIGETYFFREKATFAALQEHVLPDLVRARREAGRRLRIWSAGCSTGEEAYSIAIVLRQMIADWEEWNVTILATDINPRSLQKGSAGVYQRSSFRDSPQRAWEAYFTRTEHGRFAILPYIKKIVVFNYLNLVDDVYPALFNNTTAVDLILCRNVLMYFLPAQAKRVIENFYRSLVEGGWLVVSPCEASVLLASQFVSVNFPGAVLYQKQSQRSREAEVPQSRPEEQAEARWQPSWGFTGDAWARSGGAAEADELLPAAAQSPQRAETSDNPDREAAALYRQGRYTEAAGKLRLWLSERPGDAKAMALLARVHANRGQLDEALLWCEKAIAADKLNAGCHYLLATILQEQGSVQEARASLERTLYLDPDFVLAHVALANLALRQGTVRKSAKHFQNALSLLRARRSEDILPEAEGLTAGRLVEIIAAATRLGEGGCGGETGETDNGNQVG